jgi:hypothetical protein
MKVTKRGWCWLVIGMCLVCLNRIEDRDGSRPEVLGSKRVQWLQRRATEASWVFSGAGEGVVRKDLRRGRLGSDGRAESLLARRSSS